MVSANLALLLAGAAISAARRHPPPVGRACKTISQRKAWHNLSDDEKLSYINAELCLMEKEPTLGIHDAKNKFEELQASHQNQAIIIHGVGAFLPWHRLFMHAHETLLREECGYKGAQPYWDETLEVGNFTGSSIFDPVVGFGGDGIGDEGCIADGPFAGYINSLGPAFDISDHCISRFVSDENSVYAGQEFLDECYAIETFFEASTCMEESPHGAGHSGVGGLMSDPIASPGDPIFYLHHTFLDKVFWQWQSLDLPARLTNMGGGNFPPPFVFPEGVPLEEFFPDGVIPDFDTPLPEWVSIIPEGDPGDETTLDHILNMYGIIPNATIAEVMDIAGGLLCYEYV